VLPSIGIKKVERGKLSIKEKLSSTHNVTVLIGLSGSLRGNITISMGKPVEAFDDVAQSAIAEMANMISAKSAIIASQNGFATKISPPTVITGDRVSCIISQVKSLNVEMFTEAGLIEVTIGLEN